MNQQQTFTLKHAPSYYADTINQHLSFPRLQGHHRYDVCVIGAGMTGASAALELALKGYRVAVLEAQCMAWGASGRSGGQLIAGYGASPDTMIELLGKSDARQAFQLSVEAIELMRKRIRDYNIDCDLRSGQAEVASVPDHLNDFQQLQQQFADVFDYPVELWSRQQLAEQLNSPVYHGAWFDPNGGHIHPLNYTLGLIKAAQQAGADFFEYSPVKSIEDAHTVRVTTPAGEIDCGHVVVAANAYLDRLVPTMARRILPVGSYICATEPLGPVQARDVIRNNMAVADSRNLVSYYRMSADGRLLYGGRTGLTQREPSNLRQVMNRRFTHAFPQLKGIKIDYAWGGNVAITMNRMPDLGRLSPNVFYAHGFSGHGVLMSNMAGKLMAEVVSGTAERFDLLAKVPHKNYPGGTVLRAPGLAMAMLYFGLLDWLDN